MYQDLIAETLKELKITDVQPRWVEASMRLQYGTLGHLDRETFREECRLAKDMLDAVGPERMDSIAASFGL